MESDDGRPTGDGGLFIGGDLCFRSDPAVDRIAAPLRERIDDADLAVVNLEGAVDSAGDPIAKSGPTKTSPWNTAGVLADAGFDAVTLANNHVMDLGPAGLEATIDSCREEAIATAGAGDDVDGAMEPVRTTVDGTEIAVFSFCEREYGVATRASPGTAWVSRPECRQVVTAEADRSDVVIVVAHGGVEYVPFPPPRRQRRLRAFVEAGADLVVGHHPHVPQGWEVFQGSPIFYSLGNFLFPQPNRPKTGWGLGLQASIDDGLENIELVPVEDTGEAVREMAHEAVADDQLQYLYQTTECIADRERLRVHWQETALRLFEQRYTGWLREGVGARLRDQISTPVDQVGDDTSAEGATQEQLLVLLNLFQNESHRAVIETALGLATGTREDRRTPDVRNRVRTLTEWTEDRPLYDTPSASRAKLQALVSTLSEH